MKSTLKMSDWLYVWERGISPKFKLKTEMLTGTYWL